MVVVACPQCGAKNRVDARARTMQPKCGRCGALLPPSNAGGAPIIATDQSIEQILAEAGTRPVLVDCWAPWCGPCRMIAPAIDELAQESGGRYVVAKLNTDQNPRTAARFHIDSIPALLVFKNGQLVERTVGVQPKQALQALVMKHA